MVCAHDIDRIDKGSKTKCVHDIHIISLQNW